MIRNKIKFKFVLQHLILITQLLAVSGLHAMEFPHLFTARPTNRPSLPLGQFLMDADTWSNRRDPSDYSRMLSPERPPQDGSRLANLCTQADGGNIRIFVTYQPMTIYTFGRRELVLEDNFNRPIFNTENDRVMKPLMVVPPFTMFAVSSKYCFRADQVKLTGDFWQRNADAVPLQMLGVRIISMPTGKLLEDHGQFFSYEIAEEPTAKELSESQGLGGFKRFPDSWANAEPMMRNFGFPIDRVSWLRWLLPGDQFGAYIGGLIPRDAGQAGPQAQPKYDVLDVVKSISATLPRLPTTSGITLPVKGARRFIWQLQSYFDDRFAVSRRINEELYVRALRQNFADAANAQNGLDPSDKFLWELSRSNMFVTGEEVDPRLNQQVFEERIFEIRTREDFIAHLRPAIQKRPDDVSCTVQSIASRPTRLFENERDVPRMNYRVCNAMDKIAKLEGTLIFSKFPDDPANEQDLQATSEYQRFAAREPVQSAEQTEVIRRSRFFKLLSDSDGLVVSRDGHVSETGYHNLNYEDYATYIGTNCGLPIVAQYVPEFLRNKISSPEGLDLGIRESRPDASIPTESIYYSLMRPPVSLGGGPDRRFSQVMRMCDRNNIVISKSVRNRAQFITQRILDPVNRPQVTEGFRLVPFAASDTEIARIIRAANHPLTRIMKTEIFRTQRTARSWSPAYNVVNASRFWCAQAVRTPLVRLSMLDGRAVGDAWQYMINEEINANGSYDIVQGSAGFYNSPEKMTRFQNRIREDGLTAMRVEQFFSDPKLLGIHDQQQGRSQYTVRYQYPMVFADGRLTDLLPDTSLTVYLGGLFGHIEWKTRFGFSEVYFADFQEATPRGLRTDDGRWDDGDPENSSVVLANFNSFATPDFYSFNQDYLGLTGERERNLGAAYSIVDGNLREFLAADPRYFERNSGQNEVRTLEEIFVQKIMDLQDGRYQISEEIHNALSTGRYCLRRTIPEGFNDPDAPGACAPIRSATAAHPI